MRIALCGPVHVDVLAPLLGASAQDRLPRADGGTPVAVLAAGLVEAGHDVTVLGLDPAVDGERCFEGPRLRVRIRPERRGGRGRDAFAVERRAVTDMLADEDCDVVHAHWTYEYALGAQSAGLPLVVTAHDWAPTILRLLPDPHRVARLAMNTVAVARTQHLVVPSPYLEQRFRRWARKRPVLIPNALPDDAFRAAGSAPSSTCGGPRLLAVNQGWGRRKNVMRLLEAHALIRRTHLSCTLALLGTGYGPEGPAAHWARERGLDAGVEFVGPVALAKVRRSMALADVFIQPSLEESFGLVLIEAMAQGTAVVGGRSSGAVPWVLDSGRAGMLTDVERPVALAATISALLDDPTRRAEMAARGRAHAWAQFRVSQVVERYIHCYRAAIAGERSP